ncbi:DNA-directed RNA polymerase III subunit RPC10 [Aphidius gifuensis]|uniref:DNA-directed RNA polymerase III subunit RPC10 n=1 Tax=Aphidius gifuensis TaxID=684658 RepID=UPI001CDCBCD2|nr:DNA-directed RNA polymerase III subunit RPC10 [Aphidius gifuensis]
MLLFCRSCGNTLSIDEDTSGMQFSCKSCPYVFNIKKKLSTRIYPKLKEVEEVLGGAAAWDNVDSTDEPCPKCYHPRAFYMQIQTRSADEPATIFYRCCNFQCSHNWRD